MARFEKMRPGNDYFNVNEAAEKIGTQRTRLIVAIKKGILKATKNSGGYWIKEDDLESYGKKFPLKRKYIKKSLKVSLDQKSINFCPCCGVPLRKFQIALEVLNDN